MPKDTPPTNRVLSRNNYSFIVTNEKPNNVAHFYKRFSAIMNIYITVCDRKFPESDVIYSGGDVDRICPDCMQIIIDTSYNEGYNHAQADHKEKNR